MKKIMMMAACMLVVLCAALPAAAAGDHPVPDAVKQLPEYGLSIGSYQNDIDFENKQLVQRVGYVDLSSLNWTISAVSGYSSADNHRFWATLSNSVQADDKHLTATCDIYPMCGNGRTYYGDFGFTIATNGRLYLYDPDLSTASVADLRTALAGVKLYYVLAEPQYIDIAYLLNLEYGNDYFVLEDADDLLGDVQGMLNGAFDGLPQIGSGWTGFLRDMYSVLPNWFLAVIVFGLILGVADIVRRFLWG